MLLSLFALKSINHSHETGYRKKKKSSRIIQIADLILQFLFLGKIPNCIKGSFLCTKIKDYVLSLSGNKSS